MSLADLALNAHKTYTDAIDREDDAREIFYRYVTYNSEGKLNLTGVKYMLIDEFGFDEKDENEIYKNTLAVRFVPTSCAYKTLYIIRRP